MPNPKNLTTICRTALTLTSKNEHVKQTVSKNPLFAWIFATCALALSVQSPVAVAEDATQLAIHNATYLTEMLHGVIPAQIQVMLERISNGTLRRPASDQPVWVLEIINGTILYYQGQPSFATQPAAQLVDDAGFRFGTRAIDNGKASKSAWITLQLGGGNYRAYCATRYPFVVCSLLPKPVATPKQ